MATKIVTKNSSTASAVPTASDLVQGELAVNVADKRLFTEDNGGSIVELGTNPSTIDINAGSIDGTAIGASSASTGAFTTLTATGLTVDTDTLYVDSTNNRVGIGTTSPSTELHIASASPVLTLQDTDSTEPLSTYVSFKDSGGNEHGWMGYGSSSADSLQIANAHDDIILYTGSSGTAAERMRIDSSGNVGIGTTSPRTSLNLTAASSNPPSLGTASGGLTIAQVSNSYGLNMGVAGTGTSWIQSMRFDGTATAYPLVLQANGGNVGIGTTSPSTELHVDGTITYDGRLRPHSTASDGSAAVPAIVVGYDYDTGFFRPATNTIGFSTGGSERMRIDSSGNLLVGKTSTSATTRGSYIDAQGRMFNAQPNGASPITFQTTSNGTTIGSISVTASATSYNTSSDQRLKENITDADDAGSKVDAIQVRQYDWKADGSHQDYGMIAQELQAVAPEAVSGNTDSEEMMGVDYSKLVPMLIKEIQSLRNRVAQLEE